MLRQVDDGNRFRIPAEVEDFIALTINQHDELYDLDFWKADFTPLQRFPAPHQVQLCE